MASIGINKKFKIEVVEDKRLRDHGNDPVVQEKAKKAVAFLKKHGAPKSMSKRGK
jgi:hypothetical protein